MRKQTLYSLEYRIRKSRLSYISYNIDSRLDDLRFTYYNLKRSFRNLNKLRIENETDTWILNEGTEDIKDLSIADKSYNSKYKSLSNLPKNYLPEPLSCYDYYIDNLKLNDYVNWGYIKWEMK